MTSLLGAPLALVVALPAGALDRMPPSPVGERRLAQATSKDEQEIPAEVQGWADGAVAAYRRGDRAEALRLQQQVVGWVKAQLAPVHLFRARALSNLGLLLGAMGQREEALKPTEESLTIFRELAKTNPANLGDLAIAINNLAVSYSELGRPEEALNLSEEAVQIYRNLKQTHPAALADLAMSLSNLGLWYSELGRPEEALKPTEEAVQTYRELVKTNPTYLGELATTLENLGNRLSTLGKPAEALKTTEEALKIRRELVKSNPAYLGDLAGSLNNLGYRYSDLGRLEEALKAKEEAMKIYGELAKTNPAYLGDLAMALNNLGNSYSDLGRLQEALKAEEEAMKIYGKLAKTNPAYLGDLAMALNNLGVSYKDAEQPEKSLKATKEAIQISRELVKTNAAYRDGLAMALNNIGETYSALGRYLDALTSTEEAVQMRREMVKTNLAYRDDLASSLNNLGIRFRDLGRQQQALLSLKEAVKIYRELTKTNPAYLENLARSTTNLANLLIQQGNPRAAVPLLQETVSSEVNFLQRQLPLMAEARRQDLVDTLGGRWQLPFSLANQGEAGAALALYTRLNRHGPLQDIERRQGLLARATGAPRQLVDRLTALTAELANPSLPAEKRQQALEESERLQRELFQQLPALQPRLVEIAQVIRGLQPDGALVEFQRFSPYDPRQPSGKEWAAPRYLAMVLQASGKVAAVDLGEADPLEQAIANALDHTRRQEPQADRAWALVAETVFTPLQSQLAGLGHVLISPDGQLHRVPFSALAQLAGASRALPAQATLQTIGSGRDLVPVAADTGQGSSPLVLANPTTTGWPVLARAASEGQAVAASLGVQAHLGPGAKVALLEQARGPRILHVAAHGYFDPQAKGDPLLASGLVLAGADKARQPSQQAAGPPSPSVGAADDGYLTAKEAARLQLEGTELVVLSACETGLGSQRTGEGVFGLQRALSVAGARGTLLSLWRVPDAATETFMARFYALLRQGIAPVEAVQRVQEEFRTQPKVSSWKDPYYWAGWQYSGPPDHLQ